MAGLLDFLQSASNAAAGTVSGPVDLINLLLRKAGVPVSQAPLGGSAWMERHGLTRPVEQGAARVAGETFGLISPALVASYAPQIARGIMQAQTNMAAPATMNPQRGAIVFHGSPHKFDRFDSSKIGTGEGAQAYGHGIYLADAKEVADQYAGKLSEVVVEFGGRPKAALVLSPKERGLVEWAERSIKSMSYGARSDEAARLNRFFNAKHPELAKKIGAIDVGDAGSLYKVDLPDEAISKMLDWDKPLSQQAPGVRKALNDLGLGGSAAWDEITGLNLFAQVGRRSGGKDISKAASEALRAKGIPGIRYLDGGSRGAGTGTSNYVVFPGEEGLLKILERNGQLIP